MFIRSFLIENSLVSYILHQFFGTFQRKFCCLVFELFTPVNHVHRKHRVSNIELIIHCNHRTKLVISSLVETIELITNLVRWFQLLFVHL